MTEKIKKYLFDILESVQSIEDFLTDVDFLHYQKNKMVKRAVERELEIIGEAMSRLLKLDGNIEISSSQRIIGMRNRVIHGYDKIDDGIIWGTIKRHLPVLKDEVKEMIEKN